MRHTVILTTIMVTGLSALHDAASGCEDMPLSLRFGDKSMEGRSF